MCLAVRLALAELEEHDVAVRQRHGEAARLGAQRDLLDGQRAVLVVARAARTPLEYCNTTTPGYSHTAYYR